MALLIASSASTEQWIFTGGRFSSSTIWVFLIAIASSTVLPLIHSVASDDDAMAEPQPKVLNLASSMTPSSLTLIWSCITSPQAGAPTRPVPTLGIVLVEAAHVARVLVVLDDFFAVRHGCFLLNPFAQCAAHCMLLMSMPSLAIS